MGKRAILKAHGFGFMILYNGRLDAQLTGKDAAALGRSDAAAAVSAAKREGFAPGAILFLDQEEGGRLLPEQSAYLFAWERRCAHRSISRAFIVPAFWCRMDRARSAQRAIF